MPDLATWQWAVLGVAAVLVGFAKTGINGVGSIAVVLFAAVLPARASTGTLLPLLISADLLAIWAYRRHADWRLIARLMPWIVVGLVLGTTFVAKVNNHAMRITIGVLLLFLLAVQAWSGRHRLGLTGADAATREAMAEREAEASAVRSPTRHQVLSFATGTGAGFATMVANAAGPITTLYLLASGLTVVDLVGATAWLYFVVNLTKLPFSIGLGLVHPGSLALDAVLLPAMALGACLGVIAVRRVSRAQFERYVLVLVAVSALLLLV